MLSRFTLILSIALIPFAVCAQTPPGPGLAAPSGYILGPDDQFSVYVEDLTDEFTGKSFRIDTNGEVNLPVIGRLHAAGDTLAALESQCKDRLLSILKTPQVTITLTSFGGQPVSILGAVNTPGIRQLEGRKTLFEVLSLAGGLRQDAGYRIKITRSLHYGPIPLPQAESDPASETSSATVKTDDIIDGADPSQNILILPGDTISVPRAQLVYVIGSVGRAGGFALNEHSTISALQVLSLAEGLSKTADSDHARILRKEHGSTTPVEIAVNLKKLLDGKIPDVLLQSNDILFVPNSAAKSARARTADIIAGAAGAAIWHF